MFNFIAQYYLIIALTFSAFLPSALHAHLLPAQRGTLNFSDDGAYMALSLPISAFNDVDDNKNGLVSMVEFNKHRAEIVSLIRSGVVLSEKGDDRLLQGIMLSPVPLDEHSTSIDAQVVRVYVMGKFVLKNTATDFRFRNSLYGVKPSERSFKISARRKSAQQNDTFELTPTVSSKILFEEKKQIQEVQ